MSGDQAANACRCGPGCVAWTAVLRMPVGSVLRLVIAGSRFGLQSVMPIYEYRCGACRRRSSLFFQTFSAAERAEPRCEHCGSADVSRLVSRVALLKSEESRMDDLADDAALGRCRRERSAQHRPVGPQDGRAARRGRRRRLPRDGGPARIRRDAGRHARPRWHRTTVVSAVWEQGWPRPGDDL